MDYRNEGWSLTILKLVEGFPSPLAGQDFSWVLLAFSINMREQCAATKLSIGCKTELRKKSSGPGPYPGLEQCQPCGECGWGTLPSDPFPTWRELRLQVGNCELTWAQPLSSCLRSLQSQSWFLFSPFFVAWISEPDDPKWMTRGVRGWPSTKSPVFVLRSHILSKANSLWCAIWCASVGHKGSLLLGMSGIWCISESPSHREWI